MAKKAGRLELAQVVEGAERHGLLDLGIAERLAPQTDDPSKGVRRIGAKARSGGAATWVERESTSLRPARNRLVVRCASAERASDQRVWANSRSSLARALAMAVLELLGRTEKTSRAALLRTTVEWRMLSISLRPIRA